MNTLAPVLAGLLMFTWTTGGQAGAQGDGHSFEVASIKLEGPIDPRTQGGGCHGVDSRVSDPRFPTPLGHCVFTGANLAVLIRTAYARELGSVLPVPERTRGTQSWPEDYHVISKAPNPSAATEQELQDMLKTLLIDRFKLKSHFESKEVGGYALVVAKGGPRLTTSKGDVIPSIVAVPPPSPELFVTVAKNASMRGLAGSLSNLGIGPVVDKTGLTGYYDFSLTFEREGGMSVKGGLPAPTRSGTGPSVFTALQEELGLRLVSEKVTVSVLVVDSAEKPSEN